MATRWGAIFPLRWLREYQMRFFPADLVAGITLAAYAVPVSMAYAGLAGCSPPRASTLHLRRLRLLPPGHLTPVRRRPHLRHRHAHRGVAAATAGGTRTSSPRWPRARPSSRPSCASSPGSSASTSSSTSSPRRTSWASRRAPAWPSPLSQMPKVLGVPGGATISSSGCGPWRARSPHPTCGY